ncbi:MAG: hypothetical protein JWP44_2865 [Mucilaginibacter sp.]|nr:hypothetical protein [Mucilaginibacter sp.]
MFIMGVVLFLIPPALFPDPGMGFQVLRSMHLGGGFNNFVAPDQDDIAQNYTEFLTWWSPGQYLIPYLFKLVANINTGQAIAVTVTLGEFSGLAGLWYFFRSMGFKPFIAALSLVFISCQQAFVVPYVYYNGGEILLFAFEGWFLYGCATLKKPELVLVLFVLFSGWIGFFCKSSFLWMYAAGLCCLWIRLSANRPGIWEWIKKGFWIGMPAAISLLTIYLSFLSKGQSPASAAHGFKFTAATLSFPIASPILSDFSIDDLLHGLLYHTGTPFISAGLSIVILIVLAILSLFIVFNILQTVNNSNYRLFVIVFYSAAVVFFGFSYLRQLNISYEARHFRIVGLLIVPGIIYLIREFKPRFQLLFGLIFIGIAYTSLSYLIKGYRINSLNARGSSGVAQPNIDQQSLNCIMKLDSENKNAVFVFISDDTGLEILHNRTITLQPIGDALKINADDYRYNGYAGPLYIVLPESYNGPKEKMIMRSFPGYTGFNASMLSDKYVLYAAKMKR